MIAPITLLAAGCEKTFFGLVPWFHYLKSDIGPAPICKVKDFKFLPGNGGGSDVPLVLAAVVDDLLRVAGFIAVVFVLVGAIQYITSQGNPEETAKAQSTVVNSLIGLAVAIVAVAFVSFLGNKLGG